MYTLNALIRTASTLLTAGLLSLPGAAQAVSCTLLTADVTLPTYYWTSPAPLIYAPTVASLTCSAETPSDVAVSVSLDSA